MSDNNQPRTLRPRTTGRIVDLPDEEYDRLLTRTTRRSFLVGGLASLAGCAVWRWLTNSALDEGAPRPLRRMLRLNQGIAEAYFSDHHRAATYPRSDAMMPKVNGNIGLEGSIDVPSWTLTVEGLTSSSADAAQTTAGTSRVLTLDEIRGMPRTEMTTELRCIEGWSTVVHWGGVLFRDFARQLIGLASANLLDALPPFVALRTPDGRYYTGMDAASIMHPQTMLCYEMDGRPLTAEHGAPLRLVTPVKYGVKNIKRIGTIRFTNTRPPDYWAERGYDWYAGL